MGILTNRDRFTQLIPNRVCAQIIRSRYAISNKSENFNNVAQPN